MTLLTGLNGMGKSTIIQAILLLHQSFESGDLAAGRLLLGGDYADIGSGVDVLYEDADEDTIEISLVIENDRLSSLYELRHRFAYDRESDQLQGLQVPTLVSENGEPMSPVSSELSYLSAERLGPRKSLPLSEVRARKGDLGIRGEYVLHMLLKNGDQISQDDDPRLREAPSLRLIDQLDVWLQEISPGSHLEFEVVRAADIAISGFTFDREGDVLTRRFRATNVGFGLSYVLPVIVALVATRRKNGPGLRRPSLNGAQK
jgi:predicted ATPase